MVTILLSPIFPMIHRILIVAAIILVATSFSISTPYPTKLGKPQLHHMPMAISASASHNSYDPPETQNNSTVPFRILCLHGKGGNGRQFLQTSLLPLRLLLEKRVANLNLDRSLSFQWDEITAPYEMNPPAHGKHGGYSWWTMPPGVRSFNAKEYEGFEESAAMVAEKVSQQKTDIILGHSQGAILTAALLSIDDKLWKSTNSTPLGYILNGAAWPNPYHNSLISLTQQCLETKDSLPRMVFVMGSADKINPIESATQVHDAFEAAEFNVSIVNHAGGHSVPMGRDEDSARALDELVDWIVDIAKEKNA